MTDTLRKNATNTRGRPFKPGNAGRPKGARNRATVAAEALLDGQAEALTRKAIERALDGDILALRICLDRILPPRRDRSVHFKVSATNGDLVAACDEIMQALASGQLTPNEAATVAGLIESRCRVLE